MKFPRLRYISTARRRVTKISREGNPSSGALLREIVQQSRCKKHQSGVGPRHKAFADSVCPWHQKWMEPPRNGIQYSRATRNILVSRRKSKLLLLLLLLSRPFPHSRSRMLRQSFFSPKWRRLVVERVLNNSLLKLTSTRRSPWVELEQLMKFKSFESSSLYL